MNKGQADRRSGPHILAYGSEAIPFHLSFSPRRRLSICVDPDGSVAVKAPVDATLDAVLSKLHGRAGWIIRQRDRFATFGPILPPKRYVSGETHRYLGRQYRLRLTTGISPSVKLVGRFFEIVTPDKRDSLIVQRQLDDWYRRRAQDVFAKRLQHCLKSSHFRSIVPPDWNIRRMKRRWGSCTVRGSILLNLLLIQTSLPCIDYVITHELCHLLVHHHNAAFYRLLDLVMPDWRERKRKLESYAAA